MLSQQWYLDNMPRLKAGLEDGTLQGLPRDADILDDLRAITVVKGIPRIPEGKTKTTQGQQRHGDAAIALCLAWFASNQGGGAIDYIEVPLRPQSLAQAQLGAFAMRPTHNDNPTWQGRRDW